MSQLRQREGNLSSFFVFFIGHIWALGGRDEVLGTAICFTRFLLQRHQHPGHTQKSYLTSYLGIP